MENRYWCVRLKGFTRNKVTRNIVLIFVLILIMFIAVWTRAFIGSMKDFSKGEDFFHDKQFIRATTFFNHTIHWYTPFNPYVERSAEYLWKISDFAEQIDDEKLSLIALESIRNSFYSVRSVYSPGEDWIEKSEKKIRDILQNQDSETPGNDNNSSKKDIFNTGVKYNDPDILWTIILEIGLFSWIGTILAFIFIYLGPVKTKIKYIKTVWFWTILSVFSYSIWIIGMIKA